MAQLTWTDSIGAATLTNGKPAPANRFTGWTPRSLPYGEKQHRQSDMALQLYELGEMYGAIFELRMIPVKETGGLRLVTLADRLCMHLRRGGTCSVETEDAESNTYATCGLAPGAEPSLVLSDPKLIEYTLSLHLINLAASPVRMVCHYR